MPKVLFLRVGIDCGCGGALGPIFPNRSFEYVPIPETISVGPRSVYYRDLRARHGGTLAQYVPPRYREGPAHYDPEFETFTYGDPTSIKRGQLLRLEKGSFLVFYAGLRPVGSENGNRLYIIGFFMIESVKEIVPTKPWPPKTARHWMRNAHFRRPRPDPGLVVVRGNPGSSKLLDQAIEISDQAQFANALFRKRTGISGSLKRAVGRWVPPAHTKGAIRWICQRRNTHPNG